LASSSEADGRKEEGFKKMKREAIVSFVLVVLFLVSAFPTCILSNTTQVKSVDTSTVPPRPNSIDGDSSALAPIVDTFATVMGSNTTTWDTVGIDSPFVFYDAAAGLYKMWYTALSEPTFWSPYWVYRWVIACAESKDGVIWVNKTKVHDTGGASYYHTGEPWVLKENGTYRMWHMNHFEEVAGDWSSYIALMSSSDGISWPVFMSANDTKILSAQGQSNAQGDGYCVYAPCVIHEPSGYVMWYSVYDHPSPGVRGPTKIWRTTSSDGITWVNRTLSLPYVPGTWEAYVSHASVLKENDGTYTMFYEADSTNSSIGIASSTDGVTWINRRQFLKPSDLGANLTSIGTPFQFQDMDGNRYLYFTYSDGQTTKFGRVQLTDWWPMFHHDLTHTGTSTSTGPTTNNTLWTYSTGSWDEKSSPAIVGRLVYVGSWDGKVYCLNAATGALVWSYTTGGFVWSSPAVGGGLVYVGSGDGKVYCLNAATGALVWNYTAGLYVWSSPAVAGGLVYVGSVVGNVYCLNATTGALVWSYWTGNDVFSSPAVVGGMVYVASWVYVYCLNATTGSLVWSYTTDGWVQSSPAIVGGLVYVGGGDQNGKVYCLNAATGALVWSYTTGGFVWSSPAVSGGLVYVGSYDCNVYCLDATSGSLVWNYTTGSGVFPSPAVSGGLVYVGSWDGKVYCLNATAGALVWSYTTGGGLYSSAAVVDGVVYVGSTDGRIYAFGVHDVVVTNVSSSKNGCLPMPTVGQGFSASINVTVANQGSYTETFNVTAYANTTAIATFTDITLTSGNSTTLTFTWNTTDFAYGNYSISAFASPVEGETHLTDNTLVDGWVYVSIPGDINGDQYVNAKDAVILGGAFGSTRGDPTYSLNADINSDDWCNAKDAVILGTYFGQHW